MNNSPFTTYAAGGIVTRDAIKAAVEAIEAQRARPEPLAEFMRANGADPSTHFMLLNDSMKDQVGPFPPPYLKFNRSVPAGTVYFSRRRL